MEDNKYPWTRRENETLRAYEAFRIYMNQGNARTLQKTAEALGKSMNQMGQWSSLHSWVDRTKAYDDYLVTAEVDGMRNQLTAVRQRHMELADKLLDHLSNRLDDYIAKNADPSVRWTQAFAAGCKVHDTALAMKETAGSDAATMSKILKLIDRVVADQ